MAEKSLAEKQKQPVYQLQLRQKGEHVALRVLVRPEVGEGRIVVSPLLGRELAVVAYLPLRAELGGDPVVRLEPSQNEWLEGAAQAPSRRYMRPGNHRRSKRLRTMPGTSPK